MENSKIGLESSQFNLGNSGFDLQNPSYWAIKEFVKLKGTAEIHQRCES